MSKHEWNDWIKTEGQTIYFSEKENQSITYVWTGSGESPQQFIGALCFSFLVLLKPLPKYGTNIECDSQKSVPLFVFYYFLSIRLAHGFQPDKCGCTATKHYGNHWHICLDRIHSRIYLFWWIGTKDINFKSDKFKLRCVLLKPKRNEC